MSKRDNLVLLADIMEAINDTEEFIIGYSDYEFYNDKKTKYAVVRNLEVIGEASNRLTKDFKNNHSEVEWVQITGLRNKIIHEYEGVDYVMVWNILHTDIPNFKVQVQRLIEDYENNEI